MPGSGRMPFVEVDLVDCNSPQVVGDESGTPFSAKFVRLPKSREVCPYCGLSRSKLNQLILPSDRNGQSPQVRSKVVCAPGKRRGVRLIDLQSLMDYLEKLA